MRLFAILSFTALTVAGAFIQFPINKMLDAVWNDHFARTGRYVIETYNPGYFEVETYNPGRTRK